MQTLPRPATRTAVLLLLALMPSLLYLGHWSVRLAVPGTSAYVAIGMRAEHQAQTDGAGHGEHCHGDASCTDSSPAPAANAFGMLSEATALLGLSGALLLSLVGGWRPAWRAVVCPPLPPPRSHATS